MRSGLSLGAKRNRYLAMGGWAGEDGALAILEETRGSRKPAQQPV